MKKILLGILIILLAGCVSNMPNKSAPMSVTGIVEATAKDAPMRLEVAEAHITNNRPREAMLNLVAIEQYYQNDPRYFMDLGLTYRLLEHYEDSVKNFKKAVELEPRFAAAWNNLGMAYLSLGDQQNAEQSYLKSLDILTYRTPENAAYNLATLYYVQGFAQKAEKFGLDAIKYNPTYAPPFVLLNKMYQEQGRTADAQQILDIAVKNNPNNPNMKLSLAESLIKQGNKKGAIEMLNKLIATSPESEAAKIATDYLKMMQ